MSGKPESSVMTPIMAALPAQMSVLLIMKLMHVLRVHAPASAHVACQVMAAGQSC